MAIIEMFFEYPVPRILAGPWAARQCEQVRATGNAPRCTGLHRRGADFFHRDNRKDGAKGVDLFLVDVPMGFDGHVAPCQACAPGRNHGVNLIIRHPGAQLIGNLITFAPTDSVLVVEADERFDFALLPGGVAEQYRRDETEPSPNETLHDCSACRRNGVGRFSGRHGGRNSGLCGLKP